MTSGSSPKNQIMLSKPTRPAVPSQKGRRTGVSLEVAQERELALAGERAYRRLVADRLAGGAAKRGGSAAVGAHLERALAGPSSAAD